MAQERGTVSQERGSVAQERGSVAQERGSVAQERGVWHLAALEDKSSMRRTERTYE